MFTYLNPELLIALASAGTKSPTMTCVTDSVNDEKTVAPPRLNIRLRRSVSMLVNPLKNI